MAARSGSKTAKAGVKKKRQNHRRKSEQEAEADAAVGLRIRRLRTSIAKLNLIDFGNAVGVSNAAVHTWETGGGVKFNNLQRISERFDVSIEWLATGLGDPDREPYERKLSRFPKADREELMASFDAMLMERARQIEARKKQGGQ